MVQRSVRGSSAAYLERVVERGPQVALAELDQLADAIDHYHLFHATRAELLRALGHPYQARTADQRALELTANPAERALLHQRITWEPD